MEEAKTAEDIWCPRAFSSSRTIWAEVELKEGCSFVDMAAETKVAAGYIVLLTRHIAIVRLYTPGPAVVEPFAYADTESQMRRTEDTLVVKVAYVVHTSRRQQHFATPEEIIPLGRRSYSHSKEQQYYEPTPIQLSSIL